MTVPEFTGPAVRLTDADIAAAAAQLGVEPALIAAVAEVESTGDGFLDDGRPKILFEAHVFARETDHRHNRSHPNISSPSWDRSLYGAGGAHQYDRLAEAIALDRRAALRSASWGRFQVMGFNAEDCGWRCVEAFVASMTESEAQHLKAFIGYCQANDLTRYLIVHDWRSFTRGYNGSGQVDEYAPKLEAAYRAHAAKPPPVIHAGEPSPGMAVSPNPPLPLGEGVSLWRGPVRPGDRGADARYLQERLIAAGFDVGDAGADGWYGDDTDKAFWAWVWTALAAAGQPRV